jgi:hypothetical protein
LFYIVLSREISSLSKIQEGESRKQCPQSIRNEKGFIKQNASSKFNVAILYEGVAFLCDLALLNPLDYVCRITA